NIVEDDDLEEIEDDQVDIVEDDELEEIEDDQADIVEDDELEEIEDDQADIVEDDELEEIEDDQADIVEDDELEEIDDDQVDIVEDDELEEIEDDQVDIVDDDELEEIEDDQVDIVEDEKLEEVEDDQVDIVDEDELEEIDDDQVDIVDEDELEEIDDDQVDIVDEDELEEIEDDQVDIVDEDELEEIDDDQVDIVDEDELEEIDDDQVDIVDEDELEEIEDDQVDIVEDDELEEIDDEIEPDTGDLQGQSEEDTGTTGSGSGLPDENPEHRIGKDEEKRRLSEQFTKELSAMDRYYNSYLKIPKGSYTIGSPQPEKHEIAEYHVELNDFFIGKFPVTNALFEVFTAKTGYRTTAEKKGYGTVYTGRFKKLTDKKTGQIRSVWNATFSYQIVKGACWYHPDGPESSIVNRLSHPVVQVSLEDAFAFAAWVGKTIPSEEQWEASGRTDQGFIYPWGNAWSDQACNMEKSAIAGTSPVDRYLDFVNPYKIADLTGNVLEWTADYIPSPYATQSDAQYAITKGGSWISSQPVALWSRFISKDDYTSNTLGFRCVAR
ncbi:MAG: SUMF1/EgtB/PvdO family nonheme iron enzyme, partial [Desulfobacteraceae bacterium]